MPHPPKRFLIRLSSVASRFHEAMEGDAYYDRLNHAISEVEQIIGFLEERVGKKSELGVTAEIKRERRLRFHLHSAMQRGFAAEKKRKKLQQKYKPHEIKPKAHIQALAALDKEIEDGQHAAHRMAHDINFSLDDKI